MSIEQKEIIIVAGSGKGIGFAIVEQLLSNHPEFIVVAISRNINNLAILQKNYLSLIVIKSDLSELDTQTKSLLIELTSKHSLRALIFTAGVIELKPIGTISKSVFTSIYYNNVWSFIDLTQTIFTNIKSSTHFVSIGSMGGFTGTQKFSGMSSYSSSKAALSSFTECLAEEIRSIGASANCLVIGAVQTEMMKKAFPDYNSTISSEMMANFIIRFTLYDQKLFNGKVIPVSCTIP